MILEESLVGSPLVQIVWQRLQAKKVFFLNLVEMAGHTLAQVFQKSALGHTPLLTSFTRYTLEQKSTWMVGRSPGRTTPAADFDLESI